MATDKEIFMRALNQIPAIENQRDQLIRTFAALSVESRIQIAKEISGGGASVLKLLRIFDNIQMRYGRNFEAKRLRSGQIRLLTKSEERLLMAEEELPFEIFATQENRTGGTCTVFKIKMGDKVYAMKRLNAEVPMEVFRKEIGVLRGVNHSHIAEVFATVIDSSNRPNIILSPWCEISLDAFIRNSSIIDLGDMDKTDFMYDCMNCTTRGVVHLHSKRIKHCDLKLTNILFRQIDEHQYIPIISDFGIAKRIQTYHISRSSGQGFTLDFASPQQLRSKPYGRKTDVFSLGLVFLHIILKAEGNKRIQRLLKKDKYLGPAPGILGQKTMDGVIEDLLSKPGGGVYEDEYMRLLKGMLKVAENERYSIWEAQKTLTEFLVAAGFENGHCPVEEQEAPDEEVEEDEKEEADEDEVSDSSGEWSE